MLRWAIGGGSLVALALVLAAVASRLGRVRKATLLGAGAGALYGVQGPLLQSATLVLTGAGVLALLTTWKGYAVAVVALLGMLLIQSAFAAAPIAASYPTVVTTQLLGSIGMAVWVLGGTVRLHAASLAVGAAALLLLIVGIVLVVSSSPLVTGQGRQHDTGGHTVGEE